MSMRKHILGVIGRARSRRRTALSRGDKRGAAAALRTIRRWRAKLARTPRRCPKPKLTFHSVKNWFARPSLKPNLLVLHSTESSPGSGVGVSNYLSHGSTQADVHVVIDADGTSYRLVPDKRKAWHVAAYNARSLGIEQVGRAAQTDWPEAQLRAVACQLAHWSRKYHIPLRDARHDLTRGVVTHASLGSAGGGHTDPGSHYPFERVLKLAKTY